MPQRQWMYQIMDLLVGGGVRRVARLGAQDLSEFMSDAKLRECAYRTEIRLAWKFEKAASGTAAVIVGPASDGGPANLVGPASGRWHGKSWWPSQWALARWAAPLSPCNECNECNEFADGTRYILVTLSSLVRATFTECNECNQFFSGFF